MARGQLNLWPQLHTGRAELLRRLNQRDEAYEAYAAALALDPPEVEKARIQMRQTSLLVAPDHERVVRCWISVDAYPLFNSMTLALTESPWFSWTRDIGFSNLGDARSCVSRVVTYRACVSRD